MSENPTTTLAALLQLAWIDILLSGDNAVVIALACRGLPESRRKLGIALGAAAAVLLRLAFMFAIIAVLDFPYVRFVGGVLLLVVAIELARGENDHGAVPMRKSLWGAVATITIADGVMSLDNVLAVVGVAHGDPKLVVLGVLLSVPIVVFGAGAMLKLIERWPIVVWAGAALLGWVAGEMIVADASVSAWIDSRGRGDTAGALLIESACVLLVVGAAIALDRLRKRKNKGNSR